MFHLAFPVRNLKESRAFYENVLGCLPGRVNKMWLDLYFFGHQLTLHEIPDQVPSAEQMGVRHFGMVLEWALWQATCERLIQQGIVSVDQPKVSHVGEPIEQGKVFFRDPNHYGIELKAYRNPKVALNLPAALSL